MQVWHHFQPIQGSCSWKQVSGTRTAQANQQCHGYSLVRTDAPGLVDTKNPYLALTANPELVASFGRCIKMLMVPCSVLCGTRTRKLSAIA